MRRLPLLVLVVAVACGGSAPSPVDDAGRPTSTSTSSSTTTTVLAATGQCGLEGAYPEPWPGRPRYRVRLDVEPDDGLVTGEMFVRFTPPEDLDRLVFRLWANGPRAGAAGGRLEVTRSLVEGGDVPGEYASANAGPGTPGTVYTLRRDQGFRRGREVEVRLEFTLRMPGPVNERVSQVGSTLRLGSVLPLLSYIRGEGWHEAPAVGNFSEAVASEVADFDVEVTAPDGYTVLATGEEVEPGRFVAPASRDWAATVGRMRLAEGTAQGGRTKVVVGVAEDVRDDAEARLTRVIDALDGMAERYGPYPYPTLTVAVSGSLSGGIEFPQHFQLGAGTSNDHLVHEVAHMWFYSLVGNDQHGDPWLDEGLAEYAENRHLGSLGSSRAVPIPAFGSGRLGEGHDYWSSNTSVFYRSVYVQGLQAVAAYGDEIGGVEALDCALRRFVLEHAHGFARPDDLFASLEAQTGVDPRPVFSRFGAA